MGGCGTRQAAGRPTDRATWRPLPVRARRALRRRTRPDRVRRPHRHDEGPPGRLRDLLELRRGRAPFGARAGRHPRSAAQAGRAVRAHRARPTLRSAAVRSRRALGPRADAGGDVRAAERLRAGRARPPFHRCALRFADRERGRERSGNRPCGSRSNGRRGRRAGGGANGRGRRAGGARFGKPRPRLPDGGAPAAHARGDRGPLSGSASLAACASARRLAACAL